MSLFSLLVAMSPLPPSLALSAVLLEQSDATEKASCSHRLTFISRLDREKQRHEEQYGTEQD